MKQKFYTLEESLLEKETDSPRPKRKRLARASPRGPASGSSSVETKGAASQRFYSDGYSAPKEFMEQPIPGDVSAGRYEPERQAASFVYAYYAAVQADFLDAFIWHRIMDGVGEQCALGLRQLDSAVKPINKISPSSSSNSTCSTSGGTMQYLWGQTA